MQSPLPLRKNASDVVLCHRPINAKELASIVDDIFALDRNKATAGAGPSHAGCSSYFILVFFYSYFSSYFSIVILL